MEMKGSIPFLMETGSQVEHDKRSFTCHSGWREAEGESELWGKKYS